MSGQVYNIARGRSVSLRDVVAAVNQILGTQIEPISKEAAAEEPVVRTVDISSAERELGFCPSIDLNQALLWLIEYYAEQGGVPLPESVAQVRERRGPHPAWRSWASACSRRAHRGRSH